MIELKGNIEFFFNKPLKLFFKYRMKKAEEDRLLRADLEMLDGGY